MGKSSESMEQHGHELDQDDGEEKEDQNDTNGFQVKIFFCDDKLKCIKNYNNCPKRMFISNTSSVSSM